MGENTGSRGKEEAFHKTFRDAAPTFYALALSAPSIRRAAPVWW